MRRLTDRQITKINEQLDGLQLPRLELNAWESDFYTSVVDQWTNRQWLSERQRETLNPRTTS